MTDLWTAEEGTPIDAEIYTDRLSTGGYWVPAYVHSQGISPNGGSVLIVAVQTWDTLHENILDVQHVLHGVSHVRPASLPRHEYEEM